MLGTNRIILRVLGLLGFMVLLLSLAVYSSPCFCYHIGVNFLTEARNTPIVSTLTIGCLPYQLLEEALRQSSASLAGMLQDSRRRCSYAYSFCLNTSSTHEKVFIMVGNPSVVVPNKATW